MKNENMYIRFILTLMFTLILDLGCTLPDRPLEATADAGGVVSVTGAEGGPCNEDGSCNDRLSCVDGICVVAVVISDGGHTHSHVDAGASNVVHDAGMMSEETDAGTHSQVDAGGMSEALGDAGQSHDIIDSGHDVEPPPPGNLGESCSLGITGTSCATGLTCVDGICEETCGRPGLCENCCSISGARFCESLDSATNVCRIKEGLVVELRWASEDNNFDLYFTKAQYEHCNEKYSCFYANCQESSADPMDFAGDGAQFSENDPIMLLESGCGKGPETVYLGGSTFGNYKIGVHLNNNNETCETSSNMSDAQATVTIYIHNEFHSEYSSTFSANTDFWDLGYLDWINDNVIVTAFNGYESQWVCGGGEQMP